MFFDNLHCISGPGFVVLEFAELRARGHRDPNFKPATEEKLMARSFISFTLLVIGFSSTALAADLDEATKTQIELARAIDSSYQFPGLQKDGTMVHCSVFPKTFANHALRRTATENRARTALVDALKLGIVRTWVVKKKFFKGREIEKLIRVTEVKALTSMINVRGGHKYKQTSEGEYVQCGAAVKAKI